MNSMEASAVVAEGAQGRGELTRSENGTLQVQSCSLLQES